MLFPFVCDCFRQYMTDFGEKSILKKAWTGLSRMTEKAKMKAIV